jgi:N-methylhydantoinase B
MFSTGIARGTRYHHRMAGGGGWGDPLTRDPAAVADDVRNEKVTREAALSAYGVMIDGDGSVDEAATLDARSRRRASID